MARTFQRLELFTSLDVRDNVRVAGQIRNAAKFSDRLDVNGRADEVIEMVGSDLRRPTATSPSFRPVPLDGWSSRAA